MTKDERRDDWKRIAVSIVDLSLDCYKTTRSIQLKIMS